MIVYTSFQQGSLEWLNARAGIITASEFHQILTPKFEERTGEMPKTLLATKVAEWWMNGPLPGFTNLDMDFGKILEEECRPYFELEYGVPVKTVGFITDDSKQIGCSPDGLIGDECGLECKCPRAETHVKYLMNGELPPDYAAQVHGGMFVTGFPRWMFMSYHRHLPKFVLQVNRDVEIQAKIAEALDGFLEKFEAARATLIRLNGGPPRHLQPKAQPKPAYAGDPNDVPIP